MCYRSSFIEVQIPLIQNVLSPGGWSKRAWKNPTSLRSGQGFILFATVVPCTRAQISSKRKCSFVLLFQAMIHSWGEGRARAFQGTKDQGRGFRRHRGFLLVVYLLQESVSGLLLLFCMRLTGFFLASKPKCTAVHFDPQQSHNHKV